ncbi:MAG: hypothetical protein AAGC55_07895, partial [Myxococcota bacterium]
PQLQAQTAALSPDGTRVAAVSHVERVTAPDGTARTFHTVKVWTNLRPIAGPDDPILWTATTFCPTVAQRMDLLGVDEQRAHDDLAACRRRVAAARAADR